MIARGPIMSAPIASQGTAQALIISRTRILTRQTAFIAVTRDNVTDKQARP